MNETGSWPTFGPDDSALERLVKLSRYYGCNPDFVLGGSGNTSVKIDDRLFVKASGLALGTIDADGFVEMDLKALKSLVNHDFGKNEAEQEERFREAIRAATLNPKAGQRASVECILHGLLPQRFIVHTHATLANMFTCCRNGEALIREAFGDEAVWSPYANPGPSLAQGLERAIKDHVKRPGRQQPSVIFAENHGLIVCGETPDAIREQTERVMSALRKRLGSMSTEGMFGAVREYDSARTHRLIEVIGPSLRGLLADGKTLKIVTFDDSELVRQFVCGDSGAALAMGGPLLPEQIAFCHSYPLWIEPPKEERVESIVEHVRGAVQAYMDQRHIAPVVVLVKGVGLFTAGDDFSSAELVREIYVDAIKIMAGASRLGGVRFMTEAERGPVERSEVESYRRRVAARTGPKGRAGGKVTIVTGAAQGYGLEIARDLAAEGAHVVVADINVEGAQRAADELTKRYGIGRAKAVATDVTDGASVENAIHEVVRTYGGFDVLISNAGVLKAESVKTQPVRDFDFVTAVNYRGYFVCVQTASPVLAIQHLARPDCRSDIIQINSKSGLEGSNRNAAYAGSKFGAIGLTQSFAVELIEDGIKVNSICPGNWLDGPLWSDPQHGLLVQYLRAGKVPGATCVEDVRRAYEAKVPMRRGCTPADVMKAIYYVIEQQYETGQAVPVTGGQIMLR